MIYRYIQVKLTSNKFSFPFIFNFTMNKINIFIFKIESYQRLSLEINMNLLYAHIKIFKMYYNNFK